MQYTLQAQKDLFTKDLEEYCNTVICGLKTYMPGDQKNILSLEDAL